MPGSSAFGEHLIGEEIEAAVAAAAAAIGAAVTDFSVSPIYPAQRAISAITSMRSSLRAP